MVWSVWLCSRQRLLLRSWCSSSSHERTAAVAAWAQQYTPIEAQFSVQNFVIAMFSTGLYVATRIPTTRSTRHPSSVIVRCSSQDLSRIVNSTAYRVHLQGVVGVGVLGLVDAGYSGDWSRIGVLTAAQEVQLQQVVIALAAVNVSCALAIALILKRPAVLALKAVLTGPFALVEALYTKQR